MIDTFATAAPLVVTFALLGEAPMSRPLSPAPVLVPQRRDWSFETTVTPVGAAQSPVLSQIEVCIENRADVDVPDIDNPIYEACMRTE